MPTSTHKPATIRPTRHRLERDDLLSLGDGAAKVEDLVQRAEGKKQQDEQHPHPDCDQHG